MYYHRFNTRIGTIIVTGDYSGLRSLHIDNNTKEIKIPEGFINNREPFTDAEIQLIEYINGERRDFNLKLNPKGTDFQKKVWLELTNIPYGEVRSYKDIALSTGNGKASRAVGMANNRNPIPIIIPCHRVIGANGKLTGYAYGLPIKERLINKELIINMFNTLSEQYGKLNWWPAKTDFEMMAGAILTQNTTWKNVEKALSNFEQDITPDLIIDMSVDKLAQLIKPSGYYNQKAINLKELAKWFTKYKNDVRNTYSIDCKTLRTELLDIKGVGKETADSILVYALNKPSFVIDTYTRRILYRTGIDIPTDYDKLRELIEDVIPEDINIYNEFHGLIVEHAKRYCLKNPKCENCPLSTTCKKRI
jgi:endonuclease-3 related protein